MISSQNYTFEMLRATDECVLNVPTLEWAKKVVACGNASGQSVGKFQAAVPLSGPCFNLHGIRILQPVAAKTAASIPGIWWEAKYDICQIVDREVTVA